MPRQREHPGTTALAIVLALIGMYWLGVLFNIVSWLVQQ